MLVTFQVLNRCMWLVADALDSTDIEHFHHCGNFYWTALYQIICDSFQLVFSWISQISQCLIKRYK